MASPLTDYLRALPDDALAALLARRTDLLSPPPSDLSALAARAQSRVSLARALDGLDLFHLEILDACRLTRMVDDTTSVGAVIAITGEVEVRAVRAALERLQDLLIVYGSDDALHVVPTVDEVCSPYPAGLGRPAEVFDPAVASLAGDPAGLRRALLAATPAGRGVLDRLAGGPPIGTATPEAIKDPVSTVGALVARHLVAVVGEDTVELPREVAVTLRRGSMLGELHPRPPVGSGTARPASAVDSAGTGQVMDAVRHTDDLLSALADGPAALLRTGGMGVRDLRRLARTAGVAEPAAAVLLEVAAAAGLLGETDGTTVSGGLGEPRFLPTLGYDQWQASSTAQRWARLARAWLVMSRQPALVGRRATKPAGGVPSVPRAPADRAIAALGPELERTGAPRLRAAVLGVLAATPRGGTPDADEILAALHWRSPRRAPWQPGVADPAAAEPAMWALAEATQLGLTGLGGLTSYGRLMLAEMRAAAARDPDSDPLGLDNPAQAPPSAAVAALDKLLPPPVDHVLVQADLTVIVPGPPEPELAAELALTADHESAGAASVYRVTPDSVRRALDAGYSAGDLQNLFVQRSRTPVPQSLTYLIDDVARRHGGLRLGAAGSYLRSDDAVLLAEVIADRRLGALGFRVIAPTIVVSPLTATRLASALRDAGYAPIHEDSGGALVLTRPKVFRAPPRRTQSSLPAFADDDNRPRPPRLAAAVEALRHGDVAARVAQRAPVTVRSVPNGVTTAQAHTQAMAVLQQAVRDKARVWVGYVDSHGATASRLLRPVSIGGGYLRAEDERTEMLHTFALHRITAAVVDG